MSLQDLLIPFITIALAELGDKSQILVFLLSSKTKKHFQLLAGVMLGFLLVDGCAILLGSWIVNIIPTDWLKIITGVIFIIFGILMLLAKNEKDDEEKIHLQNPFLTGCSMILLAEWGDKTQIASAIFATKYNPIFVALSVLTALLLLSISAIYLGKIIAHKIDKNITSKIAGILFLCLGLAALLFKG